ncbi:MAG TPA: HAMP domain-containing sensor histidine kinase [Anaerolineales bacterium]|nr:HAMP domain-containing sensor histidine kinase [Anaerolineales bacterium]
MARINTLRARFALWTSGLLLAALTLFGAFIYFNMSRGLSAALDNSLTINASQVSAGLNIDNGKLILSDSLIEAPDSADFQGSGLTIRVLAPDGNMIQEFGRYHNLPVSSTQSFSTYTDSASQTNIRVYTQPVYDNNQLVAIVQVAQSLADVEDTLQRLLLALLISIPILVAVAGFSGYFLAARALAPIDQITSTARKISAEDMSARLEIPAAKDEVGRLTETLNDMLARLDDSFQRERQFTNDASHELRTPLTAMQAILGMIRTKRRSPAEYEQALDDLSEETDRLRTLVENLLRLARGDKSKSNPFEEVNLSLLLQDVADSLRPLAEAKSLALHCDTAADLTTLGDSDELIRLFVNLLDNAIKYTERGEVRVSAQRVDEQIEVQISDTGMGIAPEHLPHIFDRFYRVDMSRTQRGAGLGLAIAKEIVSAHGGTIEIRSGIDNGSTFTVHLPINIA